MIDQIPKRPTNEVSGWSFNPAMRDAVLFSGTSLRKNDK